MLTRFTIKTTNAIMLFSIIFVVAMMPVKVNAQASMEDLTSQLQVSLQTRDYPKTIEAIKGLRSFDIKDPRLDYFEANALMNLGQGIEAKDLYSRYLELDPKGEYASEAKQELASLSPLIANEYTQKFNSALDILSRTKVLPGEKREARENIIEAAKYSPVAMQQLCKFHVSGYLVEESPELARQMCERAVEYEALTPEETISSNTKETLAHMQRFGYGGPTDVEAALSYYETRYKASSRDDHRQFYLARIAEIYIYGSENAQCEDAKAILPNINYINRTKDSFSAGLLVKMQQSQVCPVSKMNSYVYANLLRISYPLAFYNFMAINQDVSDFEKWYCTNKENCNGMTFISDFRDNYEDSLSSFSGYRKNKQDIYDPNFPWHNDVKKKILAESSWLLIGINNNGYLKNAAHLTEDLLRDYAEQFDPEMALEKKEALLARFNDQSPDLNMSKAAAYEMADVWLAADNTVLDAILNRTGDNIVRGSATAKNKSELVMSPRAAANWLKNMPPNQTASNSNQPASILALMKSKVENSGAPTFDLAMSFSKIKNWPRVLVSAMGGGTFFVLPKHKKDGPQLYNVMLDYPVTNFSVWSDLGIPVQGVAASDRSILTLTDQGKIAYYRPPSKKPLFGLTESKGERFLSLAISPDGKNFAAITATTLHLGSIEKQTTFKTIALTKNYQNEEVTNDPNMLPGIIYLSNNKLLISKKQTGSEVVDLTTGTSQSIADFRANNALYTGFNHLIYGGENRWIMSFAANKILIIDAGKLTLGHSISLEDTSEKIVDLETSWDQNWIMARTEAGNLYRLKWTGQQQAVKIAKMFN